MISRTWASSWSWAALMCVGIEVIVTGDWRMVELAERSDAWPTGRVAGLRVGKYLSMVAWLGGRVSSETDDHAEGGAEDHRHDGHEPVRS